MKFIMFGKILVGFLFLVLSLGFATSLASIEFFPAQPFSVGQQNLASENFFNSVPPSFFVNPYSRLFSPQEIYATISANSLSAIYPPNSVYFGVDTCDSNGNLQETVNLADLESVLGLDADPAGPWVGKIEISPGDLGPIGNWVCHDTQTVGFNSVSTTGGFFVRMNLLSNVILSNAAKPGPVINGFSYSSITPSNLYFSFSAAAQPGYTLIGQYILGPIDSVNMPVVSYAQGITAINPNFVSTPPILLNRVPGGSAVYHVCALQDNGIEQVLECRPMVI